MALSLKLDVDLHSVKLGAMLRIRKKAIFIRESENSVILVILVRDKNIKQEQGSNFPHC
jgi:hypothetical protein